MLVKMLNDTIMLSKGWFPLGMNCQHSTKIFVYVFIIILQATMLCTRVRNWLDKIQEMWRVIAGK